MVRNHEPDGGGGQEAGVYAARGVRAAELARHEHRLWEEAIAGFLSSPLLPLDLASFHAREVLLHVALPGFTSALSVAEVQHALSLVGQLGRAVAGLQAALLQEVLVRPPSTQGGPLHRELGYSSPKVLAEHVFGMAPATAYGLVGVAESTAERPGFSAGPLPPIYPVLAQAVASGAVSQDQARSIAQGLPSDHRHIDAEALNAAEAALVGAATAGVVGTAPEALSLQSVAPDDPRVRPVASGRGHPDAHRLRPVALKDQAAAWAAFLDPDGPEPDARKQRAARALHLSQQRDGMWRISGLAPTLEGAQLKTLLDAMTSPNQERRGAQCTGSANPAAQGDAGSELGSAECADADADADADAGAGADAGGRSGSEGVHVRSDAGAGAGADVDAIAAAGGEALFALAAPAGGPEVEDLPQDTRSVAQRRFDALAAIVAHYAGSPEAPSTGGAPPTLLVITTATAFSRAAAGHTDASGGGLLAPSAGGPPAPSKGGSPSASAGGSPPSWGGGAADPASPGSLASGGSSLGPGNPDASDRSSSDHRHLDGSSPGVGQAGHSTRGRSQSVNARVGRADPDGVGGEGSGADPFDPFAFAGQGWAPLEPDPRADATADLGGRDPFDPYAFAGQGWVPPGVGGEVGPATESAGLNPFDPYAFAGQGWVLSEPDPGPDTAAAAELGGQNPLGPSALAGQGRAAPAQEHRGGSRASRDAGDDPRESTPVEPPPVTGLLPESLPSEPAPSEPAPSEPLAAVLRRHAWVPHTEQVIPLAFVARFVCSAALQFLETDDAGQPLKLGRSSRLFSHHQRKALIARDRHCRAPGCSLPAAFCEAHHLTPWGSGGASDLDNAVLLCSFHHHLAHQDHDRH